MDEEVNLWLNAGCLALVDSLGWMFGAGVGRCSCSLADFVDYTIRRQGLSVCATVLALSGRGMVGCNAWKSMNGCRFRGRGTCARGIDIVVH